MRLGPPLLYAATAGGLALAAPTAVGHAPGLGAIVGYLGAYLGVVALGSVSPGLAMWGPVRSRVAGGRGVALTFDDGPHPVHTRTVARALEAVGARATFFAIGEKVRDNAELLRELAASGHEIGIHGHRIDRFLGFRGRRAAREDLARAVDALENALGTRPTLFRPPYGVTTPHIARAARELELEVIGWSARALDGLASTTSERAVRRVLAGARDGAIVCMHDAHERGDAAPAGVLALADVLAAMRARGLACVTVTALVGSRRARGVVA